MTRAISDSHPLSRLFRGLTEHTFMHELGIGDPRVVGYVSNLLAGFLKCDAFRGQRDGEGRRIKHVTAMVAEAESSSDSEHRRDCHRSVGDFTLFWTGVYPEALSKLQGVDSPDHLIHYQRQGKRSYYLASTLVDGDEAPILRRLSFEFELCAFGLSRVRREWESIESEASRDGQSPKLCL